MGQYVITGETFSALKFQSPWSIVANLEKGVGQTVTLTLSTTDETTLINAGILTPVTTATAASLLPSAFQAFGHSYTTGAMSNASANRQTAKLAKACKGTESNHGVGSSILCTQQVIAGTKDTNSAPAGVIGVLQTISPARTPGTDPFLSTIECAVLCWGINDWAIMGGTQFAVSFPANLHTAIRRLRAGAVFEDGDASVTYPTGTWTTSSNTNVNSGAGTHHSSSSTATAQIAVPSQYNGQAITIGAIDLGVTAYTMTVTDENSNTIGSLNVSGYAFTQTQLRNGYPSIYIPAGTLAAGSHTLTVTYAQAGSTNMFFDYWSIEADATPTILIELANRIPDYTKHAATWPNAPLTDAAITTMNTVMQTVADSYADGHVVCVATDDIVANDPANLTSDGVHPNSNTAGRIAYRFYTTILATNAKRSDLLELGTT